MNNKHYELLKIFITSRNKQITYSYLADKLNLGERAVRNYITEVNEFLINQNLPLIQSLPDKSLCFDYTFKDLELLHETIYEMNLYQYNFSPEERIKAIKLLLYKNELVTVGNIIDELGISKKTCLNDMQKVLDELNEKGICYKVSNKGYSLEVTESFRRDQLIAFMHSHLHIVSNGHYTSGLDVWISKRLRFHETVKNLISILLDWQTECQLNISGLQLDQLIWISSVIILRFNSNHILNKFPTLRKVRNYYLAANLMGKLKPLLTAPYTKAEINFLATYLDGLRLISEDNSIIGNVPIEIVFQPFLINISEKLNLNLFEDHILIDDLVSHTKRSLSVLLADSTYEILMFNELKNTNSELYQSICDNIYILEHSFRFSYDDKEIMYLMLHLLAAINRNNRTKRISRFLVVCDSRVSVCNYLKETISYYFNTSLIEVASSYNLYEYLNSTKTIPNLIISLVPIEVKKIPVVCVSVPLQLNDIIHIQEKIHSFKSHKAKPKPTNLKTVTLPLVESSDINHIAYTKNVIAKNLIQLDVNANTWEASIKYGANILYEANLVCSDYIDALMKNIKINGPYFVFWKGIALSHTTSDFDSKKKSISASFIRLKTPIISGHEKNDPVKYIITLSIFDTNKYYNELLNLISLASNQEIFLQLDKAKTSDEAYQIINSYRNIKP